MQIHATRGSRLKPCDFNGLMSLYEENFNLLRYLIADVRCLTGDFKSVVSGGQDLYLQIMEITKYTTCFKLSHRFEVQGSPVFLPGLSVRIFFDSNQAEVLSWQGSGCFDGIDPRIFSRVASVRGKWRVNLFFGKWLRYCLFLGHRFGGVEPSPWSDR